MEMMGKAADRQAASLATATSSRDPELGLRAVAALRGLVEVLEALQVDNARAKGWSWQDIASRLGVTKQAVHQNTVPAAGRVQGGDRHGAIHRCGRDRVPLRPGGG
jgi:hypothetical protein